MRIAIALIVICDLTIRCSDMEALYSNSGIWPSEIMYNLGWQPGFWTIHALFDTDYWPLFIFILHFIFALFLLLGYKTQWSTCIVWILYISLHNRNLFVLQSGDDLLRLILFWGIFLSWGAYYSLDAQQKRKVRIYPFAQIGYLMLIASVYVFTALFKSDAEWHAKGTAIYYALSLEQLRLPLGDWIYGFPNLMKTLTHLVYGIELILPVLIIWPGKNSRSRLLAFVLIVFLHLSIGLTLYVGLFFWISIASALALLPEFMMKKLENRFLKKNSPNEALVSLPSKSNKLFSFFVSIIIVLCIAVNAVSLKWFPYQMRKEIALLVNGLRLNQYWGMFSPGILKKDGWLVYHGIDYEGRQWDLRTNSDYVDYQKPEHIVSMYKNDRWRKLAENMQNEKFMFLRHLYSNYYLKCWNLKHPKKKIVTLNLYFMEQETLKDYKKTETKKILYCVSATP